MYMRVETHAIEWHINKFHMKSVVGVIFRFENDSLKFVKLFSIYDVGITGNYDKAAFPPNIMGSYQQEVKTKMININGMQCNVVNTHHFLLFFISS